MLEKLIKQSLEALSIVDLLPRPPVIPFKPDKETCACGNKLTVRYTENRKISTLQVGTFNAKITHLGCSVCSKKYSPDEIEKLVPRFSNIGYDVMERVGKLVLLEHRTINEVLIELKNSNIHISSSEVTYLARKFIIYLSISHQQSQRGISNLMNTHGGYILHIDGTCEGGSPHLISVLDEISEFVLANTKTSSENSTQIIPLLKEIKKTYGNPIAIVSDMSNAFALAVSEVFPEVLHLICHFHFLRDIGKDLLNEHYDVLRKKLKSYGISSKLRYRLRYYFEDFQKNNITEDIDSFINFTNGDNSIDENIAMSSLYVLITWALDSKNKGDGYGFPFDQPHLELYQRLTTLFKTLNQRQDIFQQGKTISRIHKKLVNDLALLVSDDECMHAANSLENKLLVFNRLRHALRIALPGDKDGLNDNGSQNTPIKSIAAKVEEFKMSIINKPESKAKYQKLVNQIDKYWGKLFADPIEIRNGDNIKIIQPQKTNNILEKFFRDIRRNHRRTTGNDSICKKLQTMFSDTPLVKNLENPKYMEILLSGKLTLAELFSEIDQKNVMEKFVTAKNDQQKVPNKIKKIIRSPEKMEKLLACVEK